MGWGRKEGANKISPSSVRSLRDLRPYQSTVLDLD